MGGQRGTSKVPWRNLWSLLCHRVQKKESTYYNPRVFFEKAPGRPEWAQHGFPNPWALSGDPLASKTITTLLHHKSQRRPMAVSMVSEDADIPRLGAEDLRDERHDPNAFLPGRWEVCSKAGALSKKQWAHLHML